MHDEKIGRLLSRFVQVAHDAETSGSTVEKDRTAVIALEERVPFAYNRTTRFVLGKAMNDSAAQIERCGLVPVKLFPCHATSDVSLFLKVRLVTTARASHQIDEIGSHVSTERPSRVIESQFDGERDVPKIFQHSDEQNDRLEEHAKPFFVIHAKTFTKNQSATERTVVIPFVHVTTLDASPTIGAYVMGTSGVPRKS